MQSAVFLDRDNTLIANDGDLGDPTDVRVLSGVPEGLRALREAGFRLIVVTNQGGVARGKFTEADVDAVHQRISGLVDELAGYPNLIDRFYYCPYHPEGEVDEYRRDHPWRKPHPGMLLQAARDLNLNLSACWLIGDQGRDVKAGRAAGCRTILVNTNGSDDEARTSSDAVVAAFPEAVERILELKETGEAEPAPEPAPSEEPDDPAPSASTPPPPPAPPAGHDPAVLRAIHDLAEEIRMERLRGGEFTPLKATAVISQLLVVLLVLLGLLQLGQIEVFTKWMLGALLTQLFTMTLLVFEQRS